MIKRIIALLLFCIVLNSPLNAQTNASREDLQKQEQSLRKELDELNRLLEQTKKNKKSSLGQLAVIRSKIAKREALVNGIRKQVKILDAAIYNNQLDVQRLNKDLDTLKSRYAKSIIFSYNAGTRLFMICKYILSTSAYANLIIFLVSLCLMNILSPIFNYTYVRSVLYVPAS